MPANHGSDLTAVVRLLARNRWPFRLHATYDQTIERALNVYEAVNREVPFDGLHWIIDHAETISPRNIDRIRALGGGIAVQHRMAYQGETFINRYGKAQAEENPPITRMLAAGVPVGAGTDATRVAPTTPSCRFTGSSRARRRRNADVYRRESLRAHGSPAPVDRRQQLVLQRRWKKGRAPRRDSSRIARVLWATISRFQKKTSKASNRC